MRVDEIRMVWLVVGDVITPRNLGHLAIWAYGARFTIIASNYSGLSIEAEFFTESGDETSATKC